MTEKADPVSMIGLYLCRQRPEFILSLPKGSHTLGACSIVGPAGLNFHVREAGVWIPHGGDFLAGRGSSCLATLACRNDKGLSQFQKQNRGRLPVPGVTPPLLLAKSYGCCTCASS